MKQFVLTVLLISVLSIGNAMADPVNINMFVTPDDLTLTGDLTWDAGGPINNWKPEGNADTGAPGFDGNGSFYSNVQGSAIGGGRDFTALRIYKEFFQVNSLTVGDITKLTYWTKNTNTALRDWQVKIYTDKEWFGFFNFKYYRLNFNYGQATNNEWTQWDLLSGLGINNVYQKQAYGQGQGGNVSQDLDDYLTKEIDYIDIIAGYATNSPEVYSYLDGVEIEYGAGNTIRLDLGVDATPVPVPTPFTLLGLGLIGVAGFTRRKERN